MSAISTGDFAGALNHRSSTPGNLHVVISLPHLNWLTYLSIVSAPNEKGDCAD